MAALTLVLLRRIAAVIRASDSPGRHAARLARSEARGQQPGPQEDHRGQTDEHPGARAADSEDHEAHQRARKRPAPRREAEAKPPVLSAAAHVGGVPATAALLP